MNISYVKLFNQTVDEFFNDLISIFPHETKIKVTYNLFQTVSKVNVKKPCQDFMINIIPYLEIICVKDEQFFINQENKPKFFDEINFSELWKIGLSDKDKEIIWKYIKNFIAIGIKIVEMPEETMPLINYIINN